MHIYCFNCKAKLRKLFFIYLFIFCFFMTQSWKKPKTNEQHTMSFKTHISFLWADKSRLIPWISKDILIFLGWNRDGTKSLLRKHPVAQISFDVNVLDHLIWSQVVAVVSAWIWFTGNSPSISTYMHFSAIQKTYLVVKSKGGCGSIFIFT